MRISCLIAAALMFGMALPLSGVADHGVKRNLGAGSGLCKNANDPAKCREREAEIGAAQEACKDRAGDERKACVEDKVCAKAKDQARCRERLAKRMSD